MRRLNCDIIFGRVYYCVSDKNKGSSKQCNNKFQCKVENRMKRSTIPGKRESIKGGVNLLSFGLQ